MAVWRGEATSHAGHVLSPLVSHQETRGKPRRRPALEGGSSLPTLGSQEHHLFIHRASPGTRGVGGAPVLPLTSPD